LIEVDVGFEADSVAAQTAFKEIPEECRLVVDDCKEEE
jgi:rubredoxin